MKVDQIRKKFIKEAAVVAVIICAVIFVFYMVNSYKTGLENELSKIKRDSKTISSKVMSSKIDRDNFRISLETYRKISENKLPTLEGFANTSSRIRAARPVVEELKKKYNFPVLDITFSNIAEKSKEYNAKTLSVLENDITFKFQGMSDELVFSFIMEFMKKLPGYVKLKDIDMKRASPDVNEAVLRSIRVSIKPIPLVTGNITFSWDTLKQNDSKGS